MVEIKRENKEEIIPKKKGRPRKIVDDTIIIVNEPKKRGRKKKEVVEIAEEDKPIKRKRGRRAAPKYYSSIIRKNIPLTMKIDENDKSILHLNINEDNIDEKKNVLTYSVLKNQYLANLNIEEKEGNLFSSSINDLNDDILTQMDDIIINENNLSNNINDIDIDNLFKDRLDIRLKQDNYILDNIKKLHESDNKFLDNIKENNFNDKSEDIEENKECFNILNEFINDEKKWLDKTDVCCWWCCHTFNSVPIGLPIYYDGKKFRVKGVYCSFACMISNNEKDIKDRSLINLMYKKLSGIIIGNKDVYKKMLENNFGKSEIENEYIQSLVDLMDESLYTALPRNTLKMFGGKLSIEEFRNASKEKKVYKMVEYPLYISRDYLEKFDLQIVKDINQTLFKQNNDTISITQKQIENKELISLKKIEEAKIRMTSTVVTSNNNIDQFIKFN